MSYTAAELETEVRSSNLPKLSLVSSCTPPALCLIPCVRTVCLVRMTLDRRVESTGGYKESVYRGTMSLLWLAMRTCSCVRSKSISASAPK